MLQIIVFSFNRAMQLDTLISSLIKHWEAPSFKVDVVYNYSSEDFGKGYRVFEEKYKDAPVTLHLESRNADRVSLKEYFNLTNLVRIYRNPRLRSAKSNFRSLVIDILKKSEAENVMFLTDDSMFVDIVKIEPEIFDWINESPKHHQFSLRLGKGKSDLPESIRKSGAYYEWNMYEHEYSWGYPFSVDAHIYNVEYIIQLFEKFVFINPNTLEACIESSVYRLKVLETCRCFEAIKMLTFPINIVQDSINNISQNVSVKALNKRYLNGDTLVYGVDLEYDATKQYVKTLIFESKTGVKDVVEINNCPE